MDTTQRLSQVLDALLQQTSSGKVQDSNSLTAILDTVLPSFLGRPLEQDEQEIVFKIFQALRLLLSRSPSLIVENNTSMKVLQAIKNFYDSIRYPKRLSDSANLTLIQVISSAFSGGKLRNNRHLLAIRDDLMGTLESNLSDLVQGIVSTGSHEGKAVYADQIAQENDRKFFKLCVSVRVLQVLLDHSLKSIFMMQLQFSVSMDNFIRRTWFCMDNIVANIDNPEVLSQTSIPSISAKFDELYSILLDSTVAYFYNDDECQLGHLELVLTVCRRLLNWPLLRRFVSLQIVLAGSLMKLVLRCRQIDNELLFWTKVDPPPHEQTFHHDLDVTLAILASLRSHTEAPTDKFVNQRLEMVRARLVLAFTQQSHLDSALRLTDGNQLLDHSFQSDGHNDLVKWLHAVEDALNSSPDTFESPISRLYLIAALGKFGCMVKGDFDFTQNCCTACDSYLGAKRYICVDRQRPSIEATPLVNSVFSILVDKFLKDPSEEVVLALLMALTRLFRTYRPPQLAQNRPLWQFVQKCFGSVVREVRMLSVKLLPLVLNAPEDAQFESDFDTVLQMLTSFKPSHSTAYLFEGTIMALGEILCVCDMGSKVFVILNSLVQFMGDNDQFRSNMALHELRIAACTQGVTPWKLVEPFIPLISPDLVKRRISNPGLLPNFCAAIRMDPATFLNRTQEYILPSIVPMFETDHVGYVARQLGQSRADLLAGNLSKTVALLLVSEDEIPGAKIVKILSIFDSRYRRMDFKVLLKEMNTLDLTWDLLCLYNCTDRMQCRIKKAIDTTAQARQPDSSLDTIVKDVILGLAQNFSDIIHNNRGSKPFLEKVQAIRAIRCLAELSSRFETCISQIMTCLQLALEAPELQFEGLQCLKVVVSKLKNRHLAVVIDLIFSYLIEKYPSFNTRCQQVARDILKAVFLKDSDLKTSHPSYLFSLATSESGLSEIFATVPDNQRAVCQEFARRLRADNRWVVSLVLKDLVRFYDMYQLSVQTKNGPGDSRSVPILSAIIAGLLSASGKFSVTCTDIPKQCAAVLSMIGALDPSKFGDFFHRRATNPVVTCNFTKEAEVVEFSVYFLDRVLLKSFIASSDPQKQLFLAYAMQQYLKVLKLNSDEIAEPGTKSGAFWERLSQLSQTVLKPLLVSRYTKRHATHTPLKYPIYKETKRHAKWLVDFTEDLVFAAATTKAVPHTAKKIFNVCTVIVRDQDLSIAEFLLPYVALMAVVYGGPDLYASVEIEINTILSQDTGALSSDSAADSLKSCYRTVFLVIDYFREWLSQQKKMGSSSHSRSSSHKNEMEADRVNKFLAGLPAELLAKRTAQCNSYERAVFNLEQSVVTGRTSDAEFFGTIRHMYAELNDLDALQGVLKKFSSDSLDDKLMQFQYSEDWKVTQESLAAVAEVEEQPARITSLLKCLDDHCEYEKVLLELRRYQNLCLDGNPLDSKDLYVCGLQASIFTGELDEMRKWVQSSEQSTSITSPGSDLSIYYEFARGILSLHDNHVDASLEHANNALSNVGLALSVSREISHPKVSAYLVLMHCLYDFKIMAQMSNKSLASGFHLLKLRQQNSMKDFKARWKIQSLKRSIVKIHPLKEVRQKLGSTLVESSELLRQQQQLDLATKSITHALTIGTDSSEVNFEFAKLLWDQGVHRQAIKTLKGVIDGGNKTAEMQLQYANWLEDSANGSYSDIVKGYKKVASNNHSGAISGRAHYCLGGYYNRLFEAVEVQTPGLKRLEKDYYGEMECRVIKEYLRCASDTDLYLFEVLPKAVTIWLDYSDRYKDSDDHLKSYSKDIIMARRTENYSALVSFVKKCASETIASYQWYTVLSQLISRMTHSHAKTSETIVDIVAKMAVFYPKVILYFVYSQVESNDSTRAKKGRQIWKRVMSKTPKDVENASRLLSALKGICEMRVSKSTRDKMSVPKEVRAVFEHGSALSALALPIRANFDRLYPSVGTAARKKSPTQQNDVHYVMFAAVDSHMKILQSMQRPREIFVVGSDHRRYGILCKPHDDLRKDAKLMEFSTVMDRLLQADFESQKRRLSITVYAVVPLSESMGLIEMVNDVRTVRNIINAYLEWQGTPFDGQKLRQLMGDTSLPLDRKVYNFETLKEMYQPVLQMWFADNFANPVDWYDARNRYTRSCAVMSIVGYLLGMGDRHGDNILLNESTGQILHVDFDCLFDKGKTLAVPERVPFRLTQNLVKAMGVNGYEGTFRKTGEVTMGLIRQNEGTLMNILETFLYDPILDWKTSSKKKRHRSAPTTEDLRPQVAMDAIRRKIKGVLDPRDLDTGAQDSGGLSVSVSAQVASVIQQATSDENLAQMFMGWMPFL